MKKRLFSNIAVTLFVMLIIFTSTTSCAKKTDDTIKIGAILPLTGNTSILGEDEKIGIEIALADINKDGKKIDVIFEDNKSDAKNAITAAENLIQNGVKIIILSTTSTVMSVLEKYKDRKDLLFITAFMSPGVIGNYSNAVRIYPSSEQEIELVTSFVKTKEIDKISVLRINNELGQNVSDLFIKQIHLYDKSIQIEDYTYEFSGEGIRSSLAKIKDKNPNLIFIYSYPDTWPRILKEYNDILITNPIIANIGFATALEGKKIDIKNNVIYFLAPYYFSTKTDTNIINIAKLLNDTYNKYLNFDIAYFYDMMNILNSNIEYVFDLKLFKDNLINKEYKGLNGKISFENNDIRTGYDIYLLENNEIKKVK